jgi:hypothetical protein
LRKCEFKIRKTEKTINLGPRGLRVGNEIYKKKREREKTFKLGPGGFGVGNEVGTEAAGLVEGKGGEAARRLVADLRVRVFDALQAEEAGIGV